MDQSQDFNQNKPEKGSPQKDTPDTGSKQDQKFPEKPEQRQAKSRPDMDREGQGDDRTNSDNQADGHGDAADGSEQQDDRNHQDDRDQPGFSS